MNFQHVSRAGCHGFSLIGPGILLIPYFQDCAIAQTPIYTLTGVASAEAFGASLAGGGDIDHDGFDDLVIGAPGATTTSPHRVWVLSGRNGSVIHLLNGQGGFGVAVDGGGDSNGDGYPDILVGDPNWNFPSSASGGAWIYSGKTGNILKSFTGEVGGDFLGCSVRWAGDVDSDGRTDVILGSYGGDGQTGSDGNGRVFSGSTGQQLYKFLGEPDSYAGWSVSGCGDINGDGRADVILGSKYGDFVRVYSGLEGSLIWNISGQGSNSLGRAVRDAGDVDADGTPDFVVGDEWWPYPASTVYNGAVHVYSGATGNVLYTFSGDNPSDFFGHSVSGAGDVNQDGFSDVMAGPCPTCYAPAGTVPGYARVFSGADGSTLYTFHGTSLGEYFAAAVSRAGDVNSDGNPDIQVGQSTVTPNPGGTVHVYSGKPLALSSDKHMLSPSTGGTQLLRLNAGPAWSGSIYLMLGTLSGAKPGIPLGNLTLPLNSDSYFLYTLGNPNKPPVSASLGVLTATGTGLCTFTLPPGLSVLNGLTANHAYLLLGPSSVTLTSNSVPLLFKL